MSLNTAHANGGVLIYNGEIILLYCDGVEMSFDGADIKGFGGTKKGRIYLTTHRMVFINKSDKDPLQSFSFPFFSLSKLELEQPVFGANFIKGVVSAQPGGNWEGKAVFKLKFFSGGAIEFGQAMLKAAQMASRYAPQQPPPYMPAPGPYYPAPPPAYYPPSGGVNGFMPPTHMFPDAPPPNSVYTSDMPPPYPGIVPPAYAYPPGSNAYPQAGPNGVIEQRPPPPGFYDPAAGATAPPSYNGMGPSAPGAYAQQNGANGQAPPLDPKFGFPPPQDYYTSTQNPQMYYTPQYPNCPPPPYYQDKKEQ